jgi:hypothetical protein
MENPDNRFVTIVNSNYPPGPGVTGESANDLAYFLGQQGLDVHIVHTDARYAGGNRVVTPNGTVHKVKALYSGKWKALRLLTSFVESFILIRKARSIDKGPVVVMTDPPFLVFWASLLLRNRKWAYWSMDLYPYAFVAAGLVSHRNIFYRYFERAIRNSPPGFLISLGIKQRDFLLHHFQRNIPAVELPCGIWKKNQVSLSQPEWRSNDGKIYFGYCGNLGEAHSLEFLLSVMDHLDPTRHVMILSVYGVKAAKVREKALLNSAVRVVPNVPREYLGFIDLHLVSLLGEWNHICSPSKAFSAICAGSGIFYFGTLENDVQHYLKSATIFIDESIDLNAQVAEKMKTLDLKKCLELKKNADQLATQLNTMQASAYLNLETQFKRWN